VAEELKEETIEPKRARELIASEGGQVLDLREDDEWADARIAGAVRGHGDDLEEAIESLDEDRPLLVLCSDGKRSEEIACDLRERGFQAAAVKGGMKGWMGDGMPTMPRETEEFRGPRSTSP
jgi:tRNA 2-thiocytidine biosynthesis protein TtcA